MMHQQDPMEGMMSMMVEQTKLSDELFFKYNIEEDDFNQAMLSHNLMNDPEIMGVMMGNMRKLGIGQGMM
jgi:hypothetical protein